MLPPSRLYGNAYGFGNGQGNAYGRQRNSGGTGPGLGLGNKGWSRTYTWDEENRLTRSVEGDLIVDYRYGADGQRAVKYSQQGESLYFDAMWLVTAHGGDLRQSKNIYVGQTRIATRQNHEPQEDADYELKNTYWYHPDHLGSAQLVTDPQGQEYERIEYTPYGESWVEMTHDGMDLIPYRFTGKELDEETGLYYYGARYLDPRTSQWLSADPALGEYIPSAPVDERTKERNQNLPGMGGVYNTVNFQRYHYAGNNPVKYTDPDGRVDAATMLMGRAQRDYGRDLISGGQFIVAGTIVEDFLTEGAGILDDAGTIPIGMGMQRFGKQLEALGQSQISQGVSIGNTAEATGNGAERVKGILATLDGGRNGKPNFKSVATESSLLSLFNKLGDGGKYIDRANYKGGVAVELGDGTQIGIRLSSESGGMTVDVTFADGSKPYKVHIDNGQE